jgi:hypothetical protein
MRSGRIPMMVALSLAAGVFAALLRGSGGRDTGRVAELLGMSVESLERELGLELGESAPWREDPGFRCSTDPSNPVSFFGREWTLTEYHRSWRVNGIRLEAPYPGDGEFGDLAGEIAFELDVDVSGDSGIHEDMLDRVVRFTGSPGEGMVLLVGDSVMAARVMIRGLEQDLGDVERYRTD